MHGHHDPYDLPVANLDVCSHYLRFSFTDYEELGSLTLPADYHMPLMCTLNLAPQHVIAALTILACTVYAAIALANRGFGVAHIWTLSGSTIGTLTKMKSYTVEIHSSYKIVVLHSTMLTASQFAPSIRSAVMRQNTIHDIPTDCNILICGQIAVQVCLWPTLCLHCCTSSSSSGAAGTGKSSVRLPPGAVSMYDPVYATQR